MNDIDEYSEFQKFSGDMKLSSKSVTHNISEVFNNKKLIVNPNCPMQLILDYVSQEVGLKGVSNFDFATEEGILLNIKAYDPSCCGLVVFHPKDIYYLVLVENNHGNRLKMIPIISPTSKEYADFMVHLRRISSMKVPHEGIVFYETMKKAKKNSKLLFYCKNTIALEQKCVEYFLEHSRPSSTSSMVSRQSSSRAKKQSSSKKSLVHGEK